MECERTRALRGGNLSPTVLAAAPGWSMLGGIMGLKMVLGIIVAAPKVGILTTVIAVVLGQIVAALLFDGFGLLGEAQHISPVRIIEVLLVVNGLVLSKV